MSAFQVRKAVRTRRPLKISLEGTSGSGKTFTALRLAFAMRRAGIGSRIVIADSENNSADLYAGMVQDGEKWDYETCSIPTAMQTPLGYAECYDYLVSQGYDIIIVDSMSHAWKGALQRVDELAAKSRSGDKFSVGWKAVTPEQDRLFATITDNRAHCITTCRVKTEYDRVAKSNGKEGWEKIGTKHEQRDGTEYEYDLVARLSNEEHTCIIEKVRGCTEMDGKVIKCPGPDFWKPLFDWWKTGSDLQPSLFETLDKALDQCEWQSDVDALLPILTLNKPKLNATEISKLGEKVKRLKATLSAKPEEVAKQ